MYLVKGGKMRISKKLLSVIVSFLLTTLVILVPLSSVFAAVTVYVFTSPSSGPPGTVLSVYGTGFTTPANYTVTFGMNTIIGSTALTSSTVNTSFNVPVLPRGAYSVTITTSASDTIIATNFTITPQITLNSTTGKSGDQISVSGNGFAASNTITIYFDGVAQTPASAVYSDSIGQFYNAVITVPQTSGGNHTITAGDYGGVSSGVTYSVTSTMTLSATTGAVGSSITVSGGGFAANSALSFFLDSTPISVSASTNSIGNFSNVALVIPSISGGSHVFKVQDASANSVTANFSVTAVMTTGPATGPIDTTVAIIGKGFLASSPISVTFDGATVTSLLSLASGADGSVNTSFKIPASASGNHVIAVSDGTTTLNANFTTSSTSAITVTSGPVGTSVTANGTGFKSKGNITINYNNAQVQTAVADTKGSFTTTFVIPASSTGSHSVVISDQTNTGTYNFSVIPTINPLNPTSGYIGTSMTISGNGFGASKTINVTYDSTSVTLTTGGTTDANGTFSVSFKAPVSKSGNHAIMMTDGATIENFTFAIDATPPPVPNLTLPVAATKLGKVPMLSWTSVTDSNSGITYTLQISKDIAFGTLILEKTGLTSPTYTLNPQIPQEKLKSASKSAPYYWRVKATDAASNVSAWTTPQTFLVGIELTDYYGYIILGVIAIMLGALGFVLGRLTRRRVQPPVEPPVAS